MTEWYGWAMGSVAHLVVQPDDEVLVDRARAELERLEEMWSRFRPNSDVSRLNRAHGEPVEVDPETVSLLEVAREAWTWTEGRFDPTVYDAVVAAGYDRSYELISERPGTTRAVKAVPGLSGLSIRAADLTVALPDGVHLDLGGIGKGRAADLIAALFETHSVSGGLVGMGGDVRVVGTPTDGGPWRVSVTSPFDRDERLCTLHLSSGAVATSATTYRTWKQGDQEMHHLIDPRTCHPAHSGLVAATVIAAEAVWAEVAAKAAIVAGVEEGPAFIERAGLAGLFVAADGTLLATPSLLPHLEVEDGLTLTETEEVFS